MSKSKSASATDSEPKHAAPESDGAQAQSQEQESDADTVQELSVAPADESAEETVDKTTEEPTAPPQEASEVEPGEAVEPEPDAATAEQPEEPTAEDSSGDAAAAEESAVAAEEQPEVTQPVDAEPAEAVAEEPPAVEEEPPDPEKAAALLADQRSAIREIILASERPRPPILGPAVEEFAAILAQAVSLEVGSVADEAGKLLEEAGGRHAAALEAEKTAVAESAERAQQNIAAYKLLFDELAALDESLQSELARLDSEADTFTGAPEELQSALANYKKGIEIIQRMFARTNDRRKDPEASEPFQISEELTLPEPPENADGVAEFLKGLCDAFHNVRDANYHVVQDSKKFADDCQKAVTAVVKGLLPAVDGIDSGLGNEAAGKERLLAEHADHHEVIGGWYGAYENLKQLADGFFEKIGVQSLPVAQGQPFDPETMEPQGTVENPELNDEDVALVARRGFVFNGDIIRPAIVDVVKNP